MAGPPPAPATTHRWPGALLPEHIVPLVARLRSYLGGANYSSGRYAGTHATLFRLEEALHALDLDGDDRLLPRDDDSLPLPAAKLLYDLCAATERLDALLQDMKAAADGAVNGGRNVAAAQEAVAGWLGADDSGNLTRMEAVLGDLTGLCESGKPVLDSTRCSEAELLEHLNEVPAAVVVDAAAAAPVAIDGGSTAPVVVHGALAKFMTKTKGKLRRLLCHSP
ncbi:hypothetical protein ACP4OV_029566 [Aristida adscensionis]